MLSSVCHDIGYLDVWRELYPSDSKSLLIYMVYSLSEGRALSKRWRLLSSFHKDDNLISYFTTEFKMFYSINLLSTDNPSILGETCKA